jgi:hypothetical protein
VSPTKNRKKGIIAKGGYDNKVKQYYSDNAIENIELAYELVNELGLDDTIGGGKIIRAYNYRKSMADGGQIVVKNPSTNQYNEIYVENEKVGYIILAPARKEYYWLDLNLPNPLAIVDIKIFNQFRGKKYMTETMNWLYDFAKKNGYKSLFLRIDDNSEIDVETLNKIYVKNGFSVYRNNEDDDIFMYKLISADGENSKNMIQLPDVQASEESFVVKGIVFLLTQQGL